MVDSKLSKNGFFIVLTVCIVLVFAIWAIAYNGLEELSPKQIRENVLNSFKSTPINETYKFIVYRQPDYGFAVEYPVGFIAEESQGSPSVFKAHAATQGDLPEFIEVLVDNSTTANAEFQNLLIEAEASGETTHSQFATVNGKTASLIVTQTTSPIVPILSNETATVFQALYDCVDPVEQNNYAALLIVTIPQNSRQDAPVAQHIVSSFKC